MKFTGATLGEIVSDGRGLIQTGPFGSQLHQSDYTEEGTPVIMPTDISDGRVMVDRIARVSEQTTDRLSRHKIEPRTIVLPRRGEITKRAFIREDEEGWLSPPSDGGEGVVAAHASPAARRGRWSSDDTGTTALAPAIHRVVRLSNSARPAAGITISSSPRVQTRIQVFAQAEPT